MPTRAMNFVFISVDSLRADFTPLKPDGAPTAPFLSRLSDESTVFANAVSPSTWTLPVHGSIFTGLYPPEHNVGDKGDALGETPTLAEQLASEGYDTASFAGNGWLNVGDILRGFNHHHISPPLSRHWIETSTRGVKEGDLSAATSGMRNLSRIPAKLLRRFLIRNNKHDQRIIRKYTKYLRRVSRPFFHFIHLNGVHNPYTPHIKHYREFGEDSILGVRNTVKYQKKLIRDRPLLATGQKTIDHDYIDEIHNLYCGAIHQADRNIQKIVELLEESGHLEDTVIIVFGDHGDHLGEKNLWGHQFSVANEVICVPLILKDPSGNITASRRDDVVQLNDLYCTVLSMIDAKLPDLHSYNISSPKRDAAFVYYSTPESYIERIQRNHDLDTDQLPPKEQFAAWCEPKKRATWYPKLDKFTGDSDLVDTLKEHCSSLVNIDGKKTSSLNKETEQNLRDMGYI